jgi:iron(III) transport system permease protein
LFLATIAVVAWIVAAPAVMLVYSSLTAGAGKLPFEAHELTLVNYLRVLTDANTYQLLWTTALFTIGSTTIGMSIAVPFAWLIERTDIWLRRLFFVAMLIPMAIPNMIYAMAWIQLLNPNNGLLNITLERVGLGFLQADIFAFGGMIALQGIMLASHGYLLIAVCFRTLDASWEEQSYIAGRGVWTTMARITLPVLKPALLAAALFFTIVAMETFDIPVTLGMTSRIHVISTQIYWSTRPETGQLPDYGLSSTLSVLLVLIALVLVHFYQRQTRNAKMSTISNLSMTAMAISRATAACASLPRCCRAAPGAPGRRSRATEGTSSQSCSPAPIRSVHPRLPGISANASAK